MKRVFRLTDAAQAELLWQLHVHSSTPMTITSSSFTLKRSSLFRFIHDLSGEIHRVPQPYVIPGGVASVLAEKLSDPRRRPRDDLTKKVAELKQELMQHSGCSEDIAKVLDEKGDWLLKSCWDGRDLVEVLKQLDSSPHLALEVLNWRRKQTECCIPMTYEEYAKGIAIAGKIKNLNLADELFAEAASKRLVRTSIYNALMGAYMVNGHAGTCQLLFRELKKEANIRPSIATYNILLSVFGRLMLVDHMEATFEEIKQSNLSPNRNTYHLLISGYLTAWMWDKMEEIFQMMKVGPVKPDIQTHLLMLRGYAHAQKLDQMEETYEMVKDYVNRKELPLIRSMICAYIRSYDEDRIRKIEALRKLIPENQYRPWLNVLLITVYAKENYLEEMEKLINEAFKRKTTVVSSGIMKQIISAYFRHNEVERLANFVRRAECCGWKICRSLYHCKMVLYSSQCRLEEMENVLNEMGHFNFPFTRKTFHILFKAYSNWGQRHKVEKVVGLMCKRGHGIPFDAAPS